MIKEVRKRSRGQPRKQYLATLLVKLVLTTSLSFMMTRTWVFLFRGGVVFPHVKFHAYSSLVELNFVRILSPPEIKYTRKRNVKNLALSHKNS